MLCEALLQPALVTLPLDPDQLANILFAQPAHPIPIDKDVYSKLRDNLQNKFVVDGGSGRQLADVYFLLCLVSLLGYCMEGLHWASVLGMPNNCAECVLLVTPMSACGIMAVGWFYNCEY